MNPKNMYGSIDIPNFSIQIIDDQILFSQSFCALLQSMSNDVKCAYAISLQQAKNDIKDDNASFILVNPKLRSEDIKSFVRFCKKNTPKVKVILLTEHIDYEEIKEYLQLGVQGFFSKTMHAIELKNMFEKTYAGTVYISPDLNNKLTQYYLQGEKTTLTKRELQIVRLTAKGLSVEDTAQSLDISYFTVLAHRRNIMRKLDIDSGVKLVKYAFEQKLI